MDLILITWTDFHRQNIDLSLNGPHIEIYLPHGYLLVFGLDLHGPELNFDARIDVKPLEAKF